MVSARTFPNGFLWGEHGHALGLAWVQPILPQLTRGRERPTASHGSIRIRHHLNTLFYARPAKNGLFRFIVLVTKNRMLSALSIVTPLSFLSCQSALLPRGLSLRVVGFVFWS